MRWVFLRTFRKNFFKKKKKKKEERKQSEEFSKKDLSNSISDPIYCRGQTAPGCFLAKRHGPVLALAGRKREEILRQKRLRFFHPPKEQESIFSGKKMKSYLKPGKRMKTKKR